jgi:pilus assembly protein Flp/PilA
LKSLLRNKSGVTALEYGVIASVIVVAVAAVMGGVGKGLTNTFTNIAGVL